MAGFDQRFLLAGGETGPVVADDEAADAMRAKVVGDDVSLPIIGQMASADDFDAAMLGAAGIQAGQDAVAPMAVW